MCSNIGPFALGRKCVGSGDTGANPSPPRYPNQRRARLRPKEIRGKGAGEVFSLLAPSLFPKRFSCFVRAGLGLAAQPLSGIYGFRTLAKGILALIIRYLEEGRNEGFQTVMLWAAICGRNGN